MRPDRIAFVWCPLLAACAEEQTLYWDGSDDPCSGIPDYVYFDGDEAPPDDVGTGNVRIALGPTSVGDGPEFTFEDPWVELEFDGWYGARWKQGVAPADCPTLPVQDEWLTRAGAGWLTTPVGVDAAEWSGSYRPADGASSFGAYITAPPIPGSWKAEIGRQYAAIRPGVYEPVDIEVRAMGVGPGGYGNAGAYHLILGATWRIPGEAVDSRSAFNLEGEAIVDETW